MESIQKEAAEFQDTIIRAVNHHKGPYLIEVENMGYWMFPGCFDPAYAKAALLLMQNQGIRKWDKVLVQFSGPGLDAHLAYRNGADKVVSVEKYEMPYLCARYNTISKGLENKIDNRQGNLFEPIERGEKFDLILANPPFRSMKAEGNAEHALRDENYGN